MWLVSLRGAALRCVQAHVCHDHENGGPMSVLSALRIQRKEEGRGCTKKPAALVSLTSTPSLFLGMQVRTGIPTRACPVSVTGLQLTVTNLD